MCDVDELEFSELLRYVTAEVPAPIPGEWRIGTERMKPGDLVALSLPVESYLFSGSTGVTTDPRPGHEGSARPAGGHFVNARSRAYSTFR